MITGTPFYWWANSDPARCDNVQSFPCFCILRYQIPHARKYMFSLSLYCCVKNSFLFWARWQCNIKWEITLIRTFKIIWAYCDFYVLFEWILEINWLTRKFELLEYYELLQYLWFIMGRLQMQEMLKHIISRSRKFEISYRCIKGWCPKIYWRYIVGRSQ